MRNAKLNSRRTMNGKEHAMRKIMLRAAAVGTAMMLTAAGCKQSNDTIYVPVDKEKPVPVFDGINKDLQDYLAAPVPLKLSVDLSKQETSIESLFAALAAADKYVDLDLSGCTGLDVWEHYGAGAGKVVSLVLPDSVTKIAEGTVSAGTFASFTSLKAFKANKTETVGKWAFFGCAALTSANLPAATVIGEDAFYGCAALASASLPAATAIEGFAFSGCSALASINAPSAATIGSFAFDACTAIASINLPAAATIGAGAFRRCTSLASISLPLAATIGDSAFSSCTAITSIELPSAATIGVYAFQDCAALASANLYSTTDIKGGAFAGCAGLTDIRVSSDNQTYSVKDGMLLDKAGTALVAYPSARGAVTLPSVKTVAVGAFQFCAALETISLPAATTIGGNVFWGCTALKTASLPAATDIWEYAFQDCAALVSADLSAATAIRSHAFSSCTALESLTLGTTIPTLGGIAFYDAGRDTSEGFTIYVPDGAAKTAFDAVIDDTGSDWHKALKDTSFRGIYHGKFKEVKVTQ
jgi:hypothetical protein